MTAREQARRERALRAALEAAFECGEWSRDDNDGRSYDTVHRAAWRAENRLRKLLGLPDQTRKTDAELRAAVQS